MFTAYLRDVGTSDYLNTPGNDVTSPLPPPYIPTRNALKAVLVVVLFFLTLLSSISSFFLRQLVIRRQQSTFVANAFSFISIFGAGVFLATFLLDLVPESLECFANAKPIMRVFKGFPLPEFCIASGFLMALILEQFILHAQERKWLGSSETNLLLHNDDNSRTASSLHDSQTDSRNTGIQRRSVVDAEDDAERPGMTNVLDDHTDHLSHSTMRAILLVFALSMHAVFEGFSLGLISDVSVLLQIFGALIIHKSIVGFSLGVRLVQSQLRRTTIMACLVVFAGQVIIGGFSGLAVNHLINTKSKVVSDFVSGVAQAIAAGTFLYITCFEILPHELNSPGYRPYKVFFLLLGFLVITIFVWMFPA